jgi:predicted transcriptional regulator
MSDVLAFSRPGALLVTGLVSPQSAHTADVADLAAVLFISGKQPSEPVIMLAREKGIPLMTTPLSMFEACGRLFRAGLAPAARRPGDA